MGMYITLARINTQKIGVKTETDGLIQEVLASISQGPPADWVLNLDKEGHTVETVFKVYLPEIERTIDKAAHC